MFIMTQSIEDLAGYNSRNIDQLFQKALVWADTVDMSAIDIVVRNTTSQLMDVCKAAPDPTGNGGGGKKAQTAG